MAPPAPTFADRVAVIAAELADLSKRPVSSDTHPKLASLTERLDALVNEFVMCDRCGNLYPHIAQLTFDGQSANLCTSCGITVLQKGAFDLARGRAARKRPQAAQRKEDGAAGGQGRNVPLLAKRSAPSPQQTEGAPAHPVPRATLPEDQPVREQELSARAQTSAAKAVEQETARSAEDAEVGEEPSSGPEMAQAGAPADQEAGTAPSSPRRTAKRPRNDKALFKATVSEVAKFLKRSTREVRPISKLIEEISPPMDTEKTTRYVLAELRNTRSKMPVEVAAKVVGLLKEGIPGPEAEDGGRKK